MVERAETSRLIPSPLCSCVAIKKGCFSAVWGVGPWEKPNGAGSSQARCERVAAVLKVVFSRFSCHGNELLSTESLLTKTLCLLVSGWAGYTESEVLPAIRNRKNTTVSLPSSKRFLALPQWHLLPSLFCSITLDGH